MSESLLGKTRRGLFWRAVDQFATCGMQFVVGIFMARKLTPSDYGIAALPAVFMSIAWIFIGGGFSKALIRKPEVSEEDLSTAFYYSIIVGVVLYAVMFLASPLIANFYREPILVKMIRITALNFLWAPLTTPQQVILTRRLDFKNPARISVVNKIVGSAVGITMAYTGYGLWALVFSGLCSSLISLAQTWLLVRWYPRARFSFESFHYLFGFGNKMMGIDILNEFYANIVPVLLGRFGDAAQLGVYNRAKGYAALPSSNVAGVITGVSFPLLSKIQSDTNRLAFAYRRMIRVSSFVVFPAMTLLAALAYPLVVTMITEKWVACVLPLQVLCLTYMLQPMQILNVQLLQVKGRPDLVLRLEAIKKIVCGGVFIYVASHFDIVIIAAADFACSMFALIVNTHYTGKFIRIGYWRQILDVLPSGALCGVMFGAVSIVNAHLNDLSFQIAIGGVLGVVIYAIGGMLFCRDEVKWLIELIRIKKG